MIEVTLPLIIASFVAGVFTFFAPCTLPLVPAFLGVIAGVDIKELTSGEQVNKYRWKIFYNAIFYITGFSTVFILFGMFFSSLGAIISIREGLIRLGGVMLAFLGLFMLGVIKPQWLVRERKFDLSLYFGRASKLNSALIGALFALGWSPCIGPILGSIYFIAAGSGTVLHGTLLLLVFSVGLGLPFLITAILIGRATKMLARWDKAAKVMNTISGIFLTFFGLALLVGFYSHLLASLNDLFLRFEFFENIVNRYL